jgi:hypothetical protein
MRVFLIATLCLAFSTPALAQTSSNEPASRDDIIVYLRTMHSHDMMKRMMESQSKSMQQLLHDQLLKDQGALPKDFDEHFKKMMDDLVKGMPVDEITEASIPVYQQHFTKSDIEAMNTFYSSPVGQKVLEELPVVTQEAMQAAMPILSKYLSEWQTRVKREFEDTDKSAPKTEPQPTTKN